MNVETILSLTKLWSHKITYILNPTKTFGLEKKKSSLFDLHVHFVIIWNEIGFQIDK